MASNKYDNVMMNKCKMMFCQIHLKWGVSWLLLGEDMKRAIITERVFHLFSGRTGVEGCTVSQLEMCEQLTCMLNFCGIESE